MTPQSVEAIPISFSQAETASAAASGQFVVSRGD